MTVASLELRKELSELSGWQNESDGIWPMGYDLGYLLRKLPRTIPFSDSDITLRIEIQWSGGWKAHYGIYDWMERIADTPEDAAAKLAIELFKAGVLHQEGLEG